jgi:hypothetical protein
MVAPRGGGWGEGLEFLFMGAEFHFCKITRDPEMMIMVVQQWNTTELYT